MKKSLLLLMLALAGCAQTGDYASSPSTGQPQEETDSRAKAKVFTQLGFAYFSRGQMKVALDETRKAITADNGYGPAYNLLGLIYQDLAEDKLAEENFRKAITLNSADSDAHNNFGWFLCTRSRYEEGFEQFTDAIRNPLFDRPELAMTNGGMCSERKGDLKLAETYYIKALKLQPNAEVALVKLADLNFRKGSMNEAQRLIARYDEIAKPSAESLWLNLRIERKLGDKNQEAFYNQQLRKLFPESPETKLLYQGQYE